MTGQVSGHSSSTQSGSSTPQVAKEKAAELGHVAGERGGQVASTVAEEAKHVASKARQEARDLMDQGVGQLRQQAKDGQEKTAQTLRSLADQLDDMAAKAESPGAAADVVQEVSERARTVASWLEDREPGDLINEVRGFARRRPGVFLAGAAVAGVLVGRLTRGMVAEAKHSSDSATPNTAVPRPVPAVGTVSGTVPGLPAAHEPQHLAPTPVQPVRPISPPPATQLTPPMPGTAGYDQPGGGRL